MLGGETACCFVQRLSQDAKQAILFRGRMESVEKWMSNRHLPRRLRSRIANYYAEVHTPPMRIATISLLLCSQGCLLKLNP